MSKVKDLVPESAGENLEQKRAQELDQALRKVLSEKSVSIPFGAMDQILKVLFSLRDKNGVGSIYVKKQLFDYLHKETGEPAKKNTSGEELDKNYNKVLAYDRMLKAPYDVNLTECGAMLQDVISKVFNFVEPVVEASRVEANNLVLEAEKAVDAEDGNDMSAVVPEEESEVATRSTSVEQGNID